ncbi:MAG: response regulator, partial [Bacteroidota bacterium]
REVARTGEPRISGYHFGSQSQQPGHAVREASDGETGRSLLVADPPDLAFVDLGLPHLDGFGVAAAARRSGVRSRLVALTGYAQPEDQSRAMKAGFDAVLVKPATLEALREALARTEPFRAAPAALGGSHAA